MVAMLVPAWSILKGRAWWYVSLAPRPNWCLMVRVFFTVAFAVSLLLTSQERLGGQDQPQAERTAADASVKAFFQAYQDATKQEDKTELVELYDCQQMCSLMARMAEVDFPKGAIEGMASAMKAQLVQYMNVGMSRWERFRVLNIRYLEKNQCEVAVRSWNDLGMCERHVFWLSRSTDSWRIYDYTESFTGLNTLQMGSLGLRQGFRARNNPQLFRDLASVRTAYVNAAQLDFASAAESMDGTRGRLLPRFVEGLRWLLYAALDLQNESQTALENAEKAAAFQRDVPMLDFMRGASYLANDRPKQAIQYVRRFLHRFPGDPDGLLLLASAQEMTDQTAKAIESCRQALDDTPEHLDSLTLLGQLLPKEQLPELVDRLAKTNDPSEAFQYVADEFEVLQFTDALRAVVEYMLKHHPDELLLDYYQAVVDHQSGNLQLALGRINKSLKTMPAESEYSEYYFDLRQQIIASDSEFAIKQYELAEDKKAFYAELFFGNYDLKLPEQEKFLQKHLMQFPDDSLANLEAGDAFFAEEKYQSAWSHYSKVNPDEIPDEWAVDAYNDATLETLYRLGNFQEAIARAEDKEDTALEMVVLAMNDKENREAFEPFVKELAAAFPELVDADYWIILNQRPKMVLEQLVAYLKKHADPASRPAAVSKDNYDHIRLLCAYEAIEENDFDLAREQMEHLDEHAQFQVKALLLACQGKWDTYEEHCQTSDQDRFWEYDAPFPAERRRSQYEYHDRLSRIRVLMKKPVTLDAGAVSYTLESELDWQLSAQDDYQSIPEDQTDFVARLENNATLISVDSVTVFVQAYEGPYLGDRKKLIEEYAFERAEKEAVQKHGATLVCELIGWPHEQDSNADPEEPAKVTPTAEKTLLQISQAIAGQSGILAVIDPEEDEWVAWSDETKQTFATRYPRKVFSEYLYEDSETLAHE